MTNRKTTVLIPIYVLFTIAGCLLVNCSKADQTSPIQYETRHQQINPEVQAAPLLLDTFSIGHEKFLSVSVNLTLNQRNIIPTNPLNGKPMQRSQMKLTFSQAEGPPIQLDPEYFYDDNIGLDSSGTMVIERAFRAGKNRKRDSRQKLPEFVCTVPMKLFHKLNAGRQTVHMQLSWIHYYVKPVRLNDTTVIRKAFYADTALYSETVAFSLIIPNIQTTELIMKKIWLADSVFVRGWDYALFGPGTPDPEWTFSYPVTHKHIVRYKSGSCTNRQACVFDDTITICHYSAEELFNIGIYDSDQIGEDDYITDFSGSFGTYLSDSAYSTITGLERVDTVIFKTKILESNQIETTKPSI